MAKKLGTNYILARNTGTFGAPVFPLLNGARDIKVNLEPSGKFDSSDRSVAANTLIPTRYKASVDFEYLWDGGVAITAIRTAFLAGTSILAAVFDGAATGRGIHGEWAVTAFPIKAPLREGQPLKITLQPHGQYTNAMVFASALVTTGADAVGTKKLGTKAECNDGVNPLLTVQDMSFSLEPGALFDSSARDITGTQVVFDTVIPVRYKYSAEINFLWDPADAKLLLFWTNFIAGTPWTGYFLDGPKATTGSWGLYGDWAITGFPIDAPLAAGQQIKLTFEPHGNGVNAVVPYTAP